LKQYACNICGTRWASNLQYDILLISTDLLRIESGTQCLWQSKTVAVRLAKLQNANTWRCIDHVQCTSGDKGLHKVWNVLYLQYCCNQGCPTDIVGDVACQVNRWGRSYTGFHRLLSPLYVRLSRACNRHSWDPMVELWLYYSRLLQYCCWQH
jgi:hypothetical protein